MCRVVGSEGVLAATEEKEKVRREASLMEMRV